MATTTNKAHRSLAVLDLPKRINVLITYANGVVEAMNRRLPLVRAAKAG